MVINFIVPNSGKLSCNIGLSINYSLRRKFTHQCWKEKTNEIIKCRGKILVLENEERWKIFSKIILRDIAVVKAVGFDCEWGQVGSKRKPVALLQLATYLGNCFLFRLSGFQKNIPPSLREILENEKILKVGVGCQVDASYFAKDHSVNVNGWLDLRHLAVKDDLKNCSIGLKGLANHYLHRTLTKNWKLSASDWESKTLTQSQKTYAAEDAVVGIHILLAQLKNLWKPIFEESWETSIRKAIEEVCEPFVEVEFGHEKTKFCFVCGKNEVSVRKELIPDEYRKYFPPLVELDSNRSLILLCSQCHKISNVKENELKQKLAEEFDAPIGESADIEETVVKKLEAANAARILKGKGNRLTVGQYNFLMRVLIKFYAPKVLTKDLVNQAADINKEILNEKYNIHSYTVFKFYEKAGLIRLQTRWRQWFLDSMKPKYLPDYWPISHEDEWSQLKIKMSLFPVDSEVRGFYKIFLVGRDGDLNVPYRPDIKEDLKRRKELYLLLTQQSSNQT